MFEALLFSILFFAIPTALFAFLGVSIYRYASARKKNAREPGTVSPHELRSRKTALIVSAVLAGVLLLIVVGIVVLLYLAIAYM